MGTLRLGSKRGVLALFGGDTANRSSFSFVCLSGLC